MPFLASFYKNKLPQAEGIKKLTEVFVQGTKDAGYFDLFNKPDFSINDMVNRAQELGQIVEFSRSSKAGVYVIVLSNFTDNPDRKPEIYTGKSNDFYRRWIEHRAKAPTGTYSLYSAWRKAGNVRVFPICLVPQGDQFRTVAEQLWVSMLQTYHKEVLLPKVTTPGEAVEDASRSVAYRTAAQYFTQLAYQALRAVDWPMGRMRNSFGVGNGLNWSSPLMETETSDKLIWTKTSSRKGYDSYRRTPKPLLEEESTGTTAGYKQFFLLQKRGKGGSQFALRLPLSAPAPDIGVDMHWVFELMTNGQQHPTPWARLPDVGPHEDWAEANKLAVRAEWLDENDGQWKSYYFQASRIDHLEKTVPGSVSTYAVATGLIRYLTQRYCVNAPSWYCDYGIPFVKEVTFDNLTQTIHVRDLTPPSEPVPLPRTLSFDEVGAKLKAVGLKRVGATGNDRWAVIVSMGNKQLQRLKCDGCLGETTVCS